MNSNAHNKRSVPLWSVRMNASRNHSSAGGPRSTHISGAEGLYGHKDLSGVISMYTERALAHPRGIPDDITVKIQKLGTRPRTIRTLPVHTLSCGSLREAEPIASRILFSLGISEAAVGTAFGVLRGKTQMRGAAVIDAHSGKRLEADHMRGLRASRMGIETRARDILKGGLASHGIDIPQVREAIVLASKVASAPGIIAELCVSDDPDYTTGYIASRKLGYLRIPNIKRGGSRRGGRAFFVMTGSDLHRIVKYIEDTPVMVTEISPVSGEVQPDAFV